MFKLLLCLGVAVAVALPLHDEQQHQYAPNYSYHYMVEDLHTHDIKGQWETRDGDKVKGSYWLVEPDGSTRTVEYTADDHEGFQAVVIREKPGHHKEVTAHGKKDSAQGYEFENTHSTKREYEGGIGVRNSEGVGY